MPVNFSPWLFIHPLNIEEVLNGTAIFPWLSMAIKPPSPPNCATFFMASVAACETVKPLYSISAETSKAMDWRIKYSPSPVHETAQVLLSAYVPAPIIGESPTRPNFLLLIPPVEVAAARLPDRIKRYGSNRSEFFFGVVVYVSRPGGAFHIFCCQPMLVAFFIIKVGGSHYFNAAFLCKFFSTVSGQ